MPEFALKKVEVDIVGFVGFLLLFHKRSWYLVVSVLSWYFVYS